MAATLGETVFSPPGDDLEPTVPRHGYHLPELVPPCDANPPAIQAFFPHQRAPARTAA
jgi:hypothetical protein